jgi:hypothetical protein
MSYLLERMNKKLGIVTTEKVAPKKISTRSKKMQKNMVLYGKLRKQFLKDNPICPITGEKTTDVHHKKGRLGKLLLDTRFWLAVSRKGHKRIEVNPEWAKQMGYSLSRLNKRA